MKFTYESNKPMHLTQSCHATENDIQWLSQKLTWFLHEFFSDHLESLPFFHKWFVTIPTKLQLRSGPTGSSSGGGSSSSSSSSTIIRMVILFSGGMDLYHVMQSLNLPSSMQFDHLLQRLSFRFLCSHSLEEILTSKRLDFGSQWACRLQLDARLNKQALAQILSQLAKKLETDAAQEAEEMEFFAAEKAKKIQTESQQQQQQQATRKTSVPAASLCDSHDDDHYHLNNVAADEKSRTLKANRFANIRTWLEKAADVLGFSQGVSATLSYANVNDALLGNRWMASVSSPKLFRHVKHLVTTHGGIASEWKSGCDSFRSEFGSTHYAQGTGAGSRNLSRASSRSSVAPGTEDPSGLEHSIAASFPFATPMSTSESHKRPPIPVSSRAETTAAGGGDAKDAHASEKKQREMPKEEMQENELLELYDMCTKHLMGVSVVRTEAGTSGLTCVLEGWNFFSLLPRVAAQSGRRMSLVRTKSSTSTTSNSGSAAGLGSRNR